jgi:predicted Zn-dependent protease
MDLDTVTINSRNPSNDVLEFLEKAVKLFPHTWDVINYKGEVKFPCDNKLFVEGKSCPAFDYRKLYARLKKIKEKNPLLGITPNLVYSEVCYIQDGKIMRFYNAVYEQMGKGQAVGFVSLFQSKIDPKKTVAHALGHNRYLDHHEYPIDLMYPEFMHENDLPLNFCPKCTYKLMIARDFE